MAAKGKAGDEAAGLLAASVKQGAATLGTLARAAVERALGDPAALGAGKLFTDEQLEQLAGMLAAVSATAELQGRAGIRAKAKAPPA